MTTNKKQLTARIAELESNNSKLLRKHTDLVKNIIPFGAATVEGTCEFLFVKFKVLRVEDNSFATLAEIKESARQQLLDELGEGIL